MHNIYVADVEAIKVGQVSFPFPLKEGDQWSQDFSRHFPKPLEIYESTNIYGKHIVSTDGELWKKYRKISNPAFSEVSPAMYLPSTQGPMIGL